MQHLSQILSPARVACGVDGISKKRLLETIARLISDDQPSMDYQDVLEQLIAREKLGSTALGDGIAIPHCRVGCCGKPVGALLTLAKPIAFDAPDDKPVDLVFVLLVPEEAHQQHLDILAEIARLLGQPDICAAMRGATSREQLYQLATEQAAA